MDLGQRLNRRTILGFSLLLFFGASFLAYSVFIPALQSETGDELRVVHEKQTYEEEKSSREPGLQFRRLQLQDENGVVDPNGLRKAIEHIEKMKRVQAERSQKREGQIQEAGIARDSWTWLGPGNIGGRIRSIAIQPGNANNMFVGSVSGGIWRTSNAGASWFPVNDFMANLAVTTIVINPADNNIMFAGTGEGFGNADAIQGAGIFRSGDQGATWTQLAATNNASFNFVNRVAISPNGATLLAATNTGVWRSTDGGTNWTLTTFAAALDVDFHPTDNTRAIVGELGASRFSSSGGAAWAAATFTPAIGNAGTLANNGRVELAYAPSNGLIVYASVNLTTGVAPNISNGEVYRSTDGGGNYARVNVSNNLLLGQGWYDNAIWVNPQDPNFVIVGGVTLTRSVDGGTTFVAIGDVGANLPHADHHFIVSHPGFNNSTNRTAFFGNDGGIHRMADVSVASPATVGWTELNNNLGITQFYGAAGNQSSGVIVGGTQDNGTLRFTGGTENWTSTQGSDGGYVAADQTNANYFYGEIQNLGVFRSSDGGQTSVFIVSGITDRNCPASCQTNFIAPLVIDPSEPTRLLAGGWSLWRTNDARGAAVWNTIKNPSANSPISAITVSPTNSDFIVVGHNNGDIYLTFNGTATTPGWAKIDTAGLSNNFVTRLVIDNSRSPNWIYATFGSFSGDNVYRSTDLGATWTDITGIGSTGLPNVPVRSLVIHPHNRNLLYVGTEVGIFTSEDAGATWDLPHGGPANVSVDELFWMGGDLIAATHGRGMYRASGGFYVDCNYTGVQIGTFDNPFRTVNAAINALTTYRPIWLKPCNYNETVNSNRRLEIRSLGGTAKIGTP